MMEPVPLKAHLVDNHAIIDQMFQLKIIAPILVTIAKRSSPINDKTSGVVASKGWFFSPYPKPMPVIQTKMNANNSTFGCSLMDL